LSSIDYYYDEDDDYGSDSYDEMVAVEHIEVEVSYTPLPLDWGGYESPGEEVTVAAAEVVSDGQEEQSHTVDGSSRLEEELVTEQEANHWKSESVVEVHSKGHPLHSFSRKENTDHILGQVCCIQTDSEERNEKNIDYSRFDHNFYNDVSSSTK